MGIKARKTLRRLLPEAVKRLAVSGDIVESSTSHLFDSMMPHLSEDRISGIHIYPAPLGGWYADVEFDGMPAGIPSILGTPESMPLASRKDAEISAISALSTLLAQIRNRPKSETEESTDAVFAFEGVVLTVPIAMIENIQKQNSEPTSVPRMGLENYAIMRLMEIGDELRLPEPASAADVKALSRKDQARLEAVVAVALAAGLNRWPLAEPTPPIGQRH